MDFFGFIWIYMDLHRFIWVSIGLYGFIWISMDLYGFMIVPASYFMDWHGFTITMIHVCRPLHRRLSPLNGWHLIIQQG